MWYVGQQVVCVKDFDLYSSGYGDEIIPSNGNVYTIRWIGWKDRDIGFLLEEIHNLPRRYLFGIHEIIFNSTGFRPAKKTDISVFQKLLSPTPKERVDA